MTRHAIPQPPASFVLVEDVSPGCEQQADAEIRIADGRVAYLKSDAALRCLSLLQPRAWLLMMLFEPVPTFIRDAVYSLGWTYRRAFFGTCACRARPGRSYVDPSAARAQ